MRISLSPQDQARLEGRFGPFSRSLSTRTEARFGRKGSVSVQLEGMRAGCWYDFEAAQGGHIRTLLPDLDLPDKPKPEQRRGFEPDDVKASTLESVLKATGFAAGTATENYLTRRGITRWPEHMIRHCRHPFGMCGVALDGGGGIVAAQVVYLTDDGRKAKFDVKKRTFSAGRGWHEIAAVRLPGRGETILCEGMETGLSIWQATGRTTLCCLGIAGIQKIRLRVSRVTIARDGDMPHSQADAAIKRAVNERKRMHQRVKVATPPLGMDFNDVLLEQGEAEVARLIKEAC